MYTRSVHQLAAAGLTFAASVNTAYALAVPHVLDPRAPHFAEVMVPEPDFVLRANGSSLNDTVAFQYRNGERAWDTTMTVSLVNGNQTYLLASNVTFYNSWYVNATLNIVYDQVPDGNYTLLAAEILDGDVYNEVAQPFGISHDPNSAPPTGSMSDVDLSSASTSAYVVQSDGVTSFFPSSSSSNWYDTPSQQASAPAAAAVATASVPSSAKVDDNNSIEDALRELAEAVEGA